MNGFDHDNLFSLLKQDGPFATHESAMAPGIFSGQLRKWRRERGGFSKTNRYRVIHKLVCDLLDISTFDEARQLITRPERRSEIERRAYRLLGSMLGLVGSEREVMSKVNGFSRTADGVIRLLKNNLFNEYAFYIEMTNEVDATYSPIDLLLMVFDDRFHQKARFEAKRKLILMSLAGSIDQRERETGIESNFRLFLNFLNESVWSRESKIGELDIAFLASSHAPEDYSCRRVRVLTPEEAALEELRPGHKLTLIKRRCFRYKGVHYPIHVSIRKKPPEAKVLKLLRKNKENPAVAVDDELGLMAVVDSLDGVNVFQRHLTDCALKTGSLMTLEEISDTLTGGRHNSTNAGSCSATPMLKFSARMGGMRVEFILHTNQSYLNYNFQRHISHEEYEVKRIIDSGVADLLFPADIYQLDMAAVREDLIRRVRWKIEEWRDPGAVHGQHGANTPGLSTTGQGEEDIEQHCNN